MASTRVLVVDDHPFALATLTAALTGRGIDTRGAATAREALTLALESRPSVALLDKGRVLLEARGATAVLVSLAHTKDYAVAQAVLVS